MAYSKQGFVNGNVLDASQLIAMEDGILANETAINNIPAGPQGPQGEPGTQGYSPTITENENNTDRDYRLDITTAEGTTTTPNLKAVHTVSSAEVYSVEETVIGTWIDGKPLYRKVYLGTTGSSSTKDSVVANISDLNAEMIMIESTSIYSLPEYSVPGNIMLSSTSFSATRINQYNITNRAEDAFQELDLIVIVRYTKTTDEATVAVASVDELDEAYGEGVQSA